MSPTSGGKSKLIDDLQSVWRQTGVKPKELEGVKDLSLKFYEVWSWFLRLHKKRQGSGFGINPITYSDMESFFHLIEVNPSPTEIEIIERLDDVAMQQYAKDSKSESKQKQK